LLTASCTKLILRCNNRTSNFNNPLAAVTACVFELKQGLRVCFISNQKPVQSSVLCTSHLTDSSRTSRASCKFIKQTARSSCRCIVLIARHCLVSLQHSKHIFLLCIVHGNGLKRY
jgi:hypothetical protein